MSSEPVAWKNGIIDPEVPVLPCQWPAHGPITSENVLALVEQEIG